MRSICFFTVLIGTLALVPSMSAADVSFQAFIQGDLSYSDGESQEPMSGFEADFLPAGGSMNTDHEPDWAIGLRLGLEPSWQLQNGWRIGVVTWYNVAGYSFSSETGEQDFFSTERIVSDLPGLVGRCDGCRSRVEEGYAGRRSIGCEEWTKVCGRRSTIRSGASGLCWR